jgi:hypothetical protein
VDDALLDAVGEAPRVESVLQLPVAVVVQTHGLIFSGNPHDRQTFGDEHPVQPHY